MRSPRQSDLQDSGTSYSDHQADPDLRRRYGTFCEGARGPRFSGDAKARFQDPLRREWDGIRLRERKLRYGIGPPSGREPASIGSVGQRPACCKEVGAHVVSTFLLMIVFF